MKLSVLVVILLAACLLAASARAAHNIVFYVDGME